MNKALTISKWQSIIQQHKDSCQTIEIFCRSQGISLTSFYQWRKKLRQSAGKFLPVIVSQAPKMPANDDIRIFFPGGVELTVSKSSSRDALSLAVSVLR